MTEQRQRLSILDPQLSTVGGAREVLKVGEVRNPSQPSIISLGNFDIDLTPVLAPFEDLAIGATLAANNPLNPQAYRQLQQAQQKMMVLQRAQMPPELAALFAPFVQQLKKMEAAIQHSYRMRMHVGNRMMSQPTIPVCLNVAISFTTQNTTEVVVTNPYIGSGGNQSGAIWAITALEAPPGENISGYVLLTMLKVAGHDYINAGLGGIKDWPSDTGRATFRGLPLWAFSATKIDKVETRWRPWNIGETPGILGSIMRETGTVNFKFGWNGPTGTSFTDSLIVWCRASMCGSPFVADDVQKVFIPIGQQIQGAMKLVHQMPTVMARALQPNLNNTLRGVEEIAGFGDNDMAMMFPDD